MIFKTFENNDIDKWTYKIGIFGKSFNELGTIINNVFKTYLNNIDDFDKNISFWDALKGNLFSKDDNWIKNSLGEIVSKDNIDSYIKELDLDSAKQKLLDIFDWDDLVKNGTKTWDEYFDTCKGGNEYIIDVVKSTDDLSKLTGEDLVTANQKARASVIAHNQALQQETLGAKMSSVALKALAMAGNMFLMWAVTKVITVAAEKLHEFANATEIAQEKASSFAESVNNSMKNMSANTSTLSDLNDEYKTLSEGVNALGENVSLSSDEYERYKEIISQISDIMPEMTTYFDAQGNKIGFVKGQLSDLNEEYQKYIQSQAKDFLTNGDKNGNTFQDTLDNFGKNKQMGLLESFKNIFKNSFGSYSKTDVPTDVLLKTFKDLESMSKDEMVAYLNDMEIINNDIAKTESNRAKEIAKSILGETTTSIRNMDDAAFNQLKEDIISNRESLSNSNDADMSKITTGLIQEVYSKDAFWAASEDIRNSIVTVLSSINAETWETLGFETDTDVDMFVGHVVNAITSNKDGVADAWTELFSPDLEELPMSEYIEKVQSLIGVIADALGLDDDGKLQLQIALGFDIETDQAMLDGIREEYGDAVGDWAETLSKSDVDTVSSDAFKKALKQKKEEILAETDETFASLKQNLEDEYDKINDWGLAEYAKDIIDGNMPTTFGNVDMNNRTIIEYDEDYLKKHADVLKSWVEEYDDISGEPIYTKYDEVADAIKNGEQLIDTVWGMSNRFGEDLNGTGWEIAFTPILPDGTFLSSDTVYDYINSILQEAYADDGVVTSDELQKIDAQGRQIGNTFVQGIFAGIDDSQNYESNGNLADVIGRMLHFLGDFGAIGIANDGIEQYSDQIDDVTVSASDCQEALASLSNENISDAFQSLDGTSIGERLTYIKDKFDEGKMSHMDYFNSLQTEIDNVDFSNYTDSLDEANAMAEQFFVDSMQETASGLSDLLSKFDAGSISVSEYLDGYTSIASTLSALTDSLQENGEAWYEEGEALDQGVSAELDEIQSDLSSSISRIDEFKDSCYSLEQIMSGAVTAGSDEFKAHINVIADDLANIVANGGEMAAEVQSTLGTTTEEIASSMENSVSNQSLAAQAITANTNTAISDMATSVGRLFKTLGDEISNFKVNIHFGIKKISLDDTDMGILGTHKTPSIDFGLEANSSSLSSIGSAISSFGSQLQSNIESQKVSLKDYSKSASDAYTIPKSTLNNYNKALDKIKDSNKSAGKSAEKAAEDAEKAAKEAVENFMSLQEAALDAGKIDYQEYCSSVKKYLDDMYNSGKISAKDYFDYTKTMLEKQLSIMERVLSTITTLFRKKLIN